MVNVKQKLINKLNSMYPGIEVMQDSLTGDLFAAADDFYKPVEVPRHKKLHYTRPSTGEVLTVQTVGHHVLWANYLWNGSHWMCDYIDKHPEDFRGKSVIELGAGAGLPSVLAAQAGAKRIIITDYPDQELIDNIDINIANLTNGEGAREKATAVGYLWGSDAQPLLVLNGNRPFDMVIMCDVIFNHSEHHALLRSLNNLLSPTGIVWCVFSHYRPWVKDRDLELLRLAREQYNFVVEKVDELAYDELVIEEKRADPKDLKTVYAYRFTRPLVGQEIRP